MATSSTPPGPVNALRITGLSAGYGEEAVLNGVSLEVQPGQWVALLGPNGSGKTTLLYCIAGLLRPSTGSVEIDGRSMISEPQAARAVVGFGCAPERLPGLLTGRQCLEVHAAARNARRIDADVLALLETFRFGPYLDRFVDTYSLGTRQKLAVLLALVGGPRLIVLDEAFNGLDPSSARSLKQHLRGLVDSGRTSVLLATHALDVVERYADRAALMLSGRLIRVWDAAELEVLRRDGTLEEAIAGASEQSASPD